MKQISFVTVTLLVALDAGMAQPRPPAEDLVAGDAVGPWRRLFLDATVVERGQGLQRVFHSAQKHAANPVIVADRPWEQGGSYSGPYLYGTVMWDQGKLRMWYHVHHGGGYRTPYAESEDGVHWTKPDLGIIEEGGSTQNNLVVGVTQDPQEQPPRKSAGQCHNPSVIKRPWVDDQERRYALFCYGVDYRHARVAFSPDGLHWSWPEESREEGLFGSGDVLNFFWDPYQQRYVATWKTGSRRGRAAGVAVSDDGLSWTKPVEGPVMVADDLDPDATQIYGMPVFPYQGLYIGLPWVYNARWFKYGSYSDERMHEVESDSPCTMDVQLTWSWDLINWTRPWPRSQFIPRGGEGEFDSGMIYTARAPVQMGDELWFYYGGWDGPHNDPSSQAAIGVATLRLDGFCSMRAGEEEGWLISRREPFVVPRITINARTGEAGYVVAELLDAEGEVIPGFSRDQCNAFTGDSVRHVLTWKAEELPEEARHGDKKIRFILRNADLFSYLPDQTREPATVIYDPGANGGLLPFDEQIPAGQRFHATGLPSGYQIAEEDGLVYLDLHSAAELETSAALSRDADFDDETDWCVEAWYRVVDQGTEPIYGLATFFRPNAGRAAALYLSENAVGLLTQKVNDYTLVAEHEMDTTDGFHWYRMVHEGGADGTVAVLVDGEEIARAPLAELEANTARWPNVVFGPNAGHREGRLHVAKFGYRTGSTEPIFGPVEP
ncbi:MAG: hypothetical protein ACP5KN_10675 [Armatimonadota bacterium]